MKYMKRAKIYRASNVTFHPETIEAFSYSWWKFVGVVEGKVVFNNYRYSNSTTKHQWKVRSLMRELGIQIDLELPLMSGLPGSYLRYGQILPYSTLEEMIVAAEEQVCHEYLSQIIKRQDAYHRRKEKREYKKSLEIAIVTHNAQAELPQAPIQFGGLRLVK